MPRAASQRTNHPDPGLPFPVPGHQEVVTVIISTTSTNWLSVMFQGPYSHFSCHCSAMKVQLSLGGETEAQRG